MCLFYYMIRSFALHQWIFIIHVESIDNAKVVKSRAWRRKDRCLLWRIEQERCLFPEVKNEIRHDWQASRQKCFLKKEEEIEMTDPWSVHGWESGGLNKERMNEINPMHGNFLSYKIMHCITFHISHQACVFSSSEIGMQSHVPDESFRKTFGEKEDNSNRSELLKDPFQPSQSSTN